ncbi:MAG: FAD-dependent monooxygenase [Chloroflexota bacterium]
MSAPEQVEIAIVGGGPAGAVLAARLASAGRDVVVLERSPAWHWRAGGVFTSPAAVAALRRVGLGDATLASVARPIPAMRVETLGGTTFRLTYGADAGGEPAVGFDRSRLDPALLDLALAAGAKVRRGWQVTNVDLDTGVLEALDADGSRAFIKVSVIVGADGPHSVVARAAGVARRARLDPRIGLTYHLPDPDPTGCRDARMRVLRDGYIGIAPVAGGRVNVGIVLGRSWLPALARDGARTIADEIVAAIPAVDGDPADWRHGDPTDSIAGASPLGHRVTRRADRGWLLVGDAAGFLDPFTGEGLHRALVSAELAAAAITARQRGRAAAFAAYDRSMQRHFLAKDAVSWLVQAFLGQPALFEYAATRIAARPAVRATMGLVMGDLVPAGRALDPRFLAALLAP